MKFNMKKEITYEDYNKIQIVVGTVLTVSKNEKARKPSLVVEVDFGSEVGVRKSSAQITTLYKKEDLLNRQIIAIVNFPKKQIANFMSECLVMGAVKEKDVFLLHPETKVKNGSQVS